MVILHIALQDGFRNDTVVVRVNQREVYRRTGVSTNLAISRADAFEVEVEEGAVRVEVELPGRNRSGAVSLEPAQTPYLAVEIAPEGSLLLTPSAEPFRYF